MDDRAVEQSDGSANEGTLIHFGRNIDEFENYALEEGFGRAQFRFGAVRLSVSRGRHHSLRRLRGQVMMTATLLGDNLDDLSEFLGAEDQERIDEIYTTLTEVGIPESYRDVIRAAREAARLYSALLEDIDDRERFTEEPGDSG